MKKRVLALVLSLLMLVSALAGCGAETQAPEETKEPAEQVGSSTPAAEDEAIPVDYFAGETIQIMVKKKPEDTCMDWNQKEIIQVVEEATGIHVEWVLLEASAAAEQVAATLLSNDKPDAYIYAIDETTLLNNADLFYDLSEEGLLQKWAPNVYADMEAMDLWATVRFTDGSIRGLNTGTQFADASSWAASPLVINQEWLDKLGMDVPTNAEEFYNVLVAFRDNDMDGDGDPTNEIPLTFCNGFWEGDLLMQANAFGIGGNATWQAKDAYKNIKDGKVISTVDTDNYRAFLEFYHKLAEEGLLDLEGFSQTADQYNAKRQSGSTGCFTSFMQLMDQGYTPFIYQAIEGVEPQMTGLVNRYNGLRSNFVISADSDKVEVVLHWWNYMSSTTELKLMAEGQPYEEIDGVYYWLPYAEGAQDKATTALHNFGPMLRLEEQMVKADDKLAANLLARTKFVEANKDLLNQEGFPVAYYYPEKEEERGFLEVELFSYIGNFTAQAIVNGVTDESWEQHLKDLETMQYYDWLDWYQEFVDFVNSNK